MGSNYVIGIDAGTSVIKCSIFDLDGVEIAGHSQRIEVVNPHPGWSEQDMHLVWKTAASVIRETITSANIDPYDIAVIGPTGQGDGAWLLDSQRNPIMMVPLWNDARAGSVIESWQSQGILDEVYARNATYLWPGTVAAILTWMKQFRPDEYKKIDVILSCKDWIKYQLTGVICTDETDGSIPFMNLAQRKYDPEILKILELSEIEECLARVTPSHEVIGHVTSDASAQTGLAVGTPVVSGMMDVIANAIGTGTLYANQSFTILGTTGINCMVLDDPIFEPANIGASSCHSVPGHWLRLLGAMAGTPNLDWYIAQMGEGFAIEAQQKGLDVFTLLENEVRAVPAGSSGVIFHPYLLGERAPFLNPSATGAFFGVNMNTKRDQLARAVYEGVAYSVRHCYSLMGHVEKVVLAGGGARSGVWCQILADMLNCRIVVPEGTQFGTLGAAIAGAVGVELFESYDVAVQRFVKVAREYTPNPMNTAVYDQFFPLYVDLIDVMSDFWSRRKQILEVSREYK